jgi:hypothetical protein
MAGRGAKKIITIKYQQAMKKSHGVSDPCDQYMYEQWVY